MLFQRYSSPMAYLDRMIATGRLHEFVDGFVDLYNEDMEDKTTWEVWLHRIFDKGYDEFRKALRGETKAAPTPEELKSTVMESKSILNGFVPDEGLVDRRGTVQAAGNDSG